MPRLSPNKDIPVAITNLRLCSALQNCGATGVDDAFDKSSAVHLYVYDDQRLRCTDWNDIEPDFVSKCFIATNPNNNTIVLLPLDGKILTGTSVIAGGVCDGMLLTDKEMTLIEFKTNVTSSNNKTIVQRANEAIEQLWHTFDGIIKPKCDERNRNIELFLNIDFYVVFDKDLEITAASSELMDLQIQFVEDYKFQLYFNNEKTFQ